MTSSLDPLETSSGGWPMIPADALHLPVVVADLDGTLRGEVLPMVRLARPLVPDFLGKIMLREPLNAGKFVRFALNLSTLWALRTIRAEHRRRYKHVFSELHSLAAALFSDATCEEIRDTYRNYLPQLPGLWSQSAIELLRRATQQANVVLVTGSEQIQTEECVRLLCDEGVMTERIFVRGSLYDYHPTELRFTGTVRHLNVTLEGKRDALNDLTEWPTCRIVAAAGNSRPDRALFESVESGGLCVLVSPHSVVRERKQQQIVIGKLQRSGYRLFWDATEYLDAADEHRDNRGAGDRPLLVVPPNFGPVLDNVELQERFPVFFSECDTPEWLGASGFNGDVTRQSAGPFEYSGTCHPKDGSAMKRTPTVARRLGHRR